MAASQFTLAALATAAVPGLDLVGVEPTGSDDGETASALVTDRRGGMWIVQVPLTTESNARQSAALAGLAAITPGVRARLPFAVPTFAGQAPIGDGRALVYDYVGGRHIAVPDIRPGSTLAISIGHCIAAVHSLPVTVVVDAGLTRLSAADCLRQAVGVVDRAEATGRTPPTLLERWDRILTHGELWQFQPTVINGSLRIESFLAEHEQVTSILDWSELKIADPASDLHWVLAGTDPAVSETVFDSYAISRRVPVDHAFRLRARFYAELELAKWLLHGIDLQDAAIVEDAVSMMDALLEQVRIAEPLLTATGDGPLGLDDVRELLNREHPSIYPPTRPDSTIAPDE